jgi:ABC-type transport system involved in multi-copper enzyme maturation permease subunit
MKIRTIAISTLGSFLRNKVIILFCSLFACVVLLSMAPLMEYKAMTNASNAQQMHGVVLNEIADVMSLVSGFGSLLAAWAAADSIATEMRSGTILAVMARPLRRWEFLVGKYLGVLVLMAIYIVAMLGVTFLLAWTAGQQFHTSSWTLLAYPFVRYAVWAAIAMFLATIVHPIFVMGIVGLLATLVAICEAPSHIPVWLRLPIHLLLPMTGLLSEERFLAITRASLRPFPWTNHATALAYGVNYALVWLLFAIWMFQRRSLTRD